jgi:ABC-2 type transport system permease protein
MKYLAFARIAFLQETAQRGALLGRALFYIMVLLIFSHIWKALAANGVFTTQASAGMLWYLALTEWILLSVPLLHIEIERDVRSGDIAYQLSRPVSYLTMRIAEALGAFLFRLVVLGIVGFSFAWLYSGTLPEQPFGLFLAVPLGLLAGFVYSLFLASIGLSAFWLQDANPVSWVWQKLGFIFGGLIFPLSIYPEWLRSFSAWTPFYFLLFGPAQSAVTADSQLAIRSFLGLLFWGFVALLLLRFLYLKGQSQLQVNGG